MKYILIVVLPLCLFACNEPKSNRQELQNRIDSLEAKLAEVYKPGFGEFMTSIQAHHSKLWFAGQNQNWKLAEFEVHEIMEALDDINKYQALRTESKEIGLLNPVLDSINIAIQQQNPAMFKSSYIVLTNTCNNCHIAVDFEFNVVKIPDTSPFSNQDFKINK